MHEWGRARDAFLLGTEYGAVFKGMDYGTRLTRFESWHHHLNTLGELTFSVSLKSHKILSELNGFSQRMFETCLAHSRCLIKCQVSPIPPFPQDQNPNKSPGFWKLPGTGSVGFQTVPPVTLSDISSVLSLPLFYSLALYATPSIPLPLGFEFCVCIASVVHSSSSSLF